MLHNDLRFGENGERVPAADFDYDAVDKASSESTNQHDIDAAVKVFERLLLWIFQDGMNNPDGVKIRAMICCWIFLKVLRPQNLTQFAKGYGMYKQSLGRWVDDFKVKFPEVQTVHMRPINEHIESRTR